MSGGGGGSSGTWKKVLALGTVLCGVAYLLPHLSSDEVPGLEPGLLGLGGLMVVFGSCEAMIEAVEGLGARLGWNQFVAGAMAGLASNVPEIVMLGFVVAAEPRVAFVVVALTLHVNALAFAIYSLALPRDAAGTVRMPDALVKQSTDLFAAGGGVFLATGLLMLSMYVFRSGPGGSGLDAIDLVVIGLALLLVQVVATVELVKRFGKRAAAAVDGEAAIAPPTRTAPLPSWGNITGHATVGLGASLLGGHAVGDFADALVGALVGAGYSEMVGAIVLSVFSGAGAFVMMISAHRKGMHDIALAGVSGAITQVPFVVLPCVMILMAVLSLFGVVETFGGGTVLRIDLETTSVVLLAFPPMLILWKSVQDDGTVNWLESAGMVAVFGLTIYLLARHG